MFVERKSTVGLRVSLKRPLAGTEWNSPAAIARIVATFVADEAVQEIRLTQQEVVLYVAMATTEASAEGVRRVEAALHELARAAAEGA